MSRRSGFDLVLGVLAMLAAALAYLVGFAALALLARLLVLGWLWILLPLGLPVLVNNVLAIAAAGVTAFTGWRFIRLLLPQAGPRLDA